VTEQLVAFFRREAEAGNIEFHEVDADGEIYVRGHFSVADLAGYVRIPEAGSEAEAAMVEAGALALCGATKPPEKPGAWWREQEGVARRVITAALRSLRQDTGGEG
jgi:hypothetical protein